MNYGELGNYNNMKRSAEQLARKYKGIDNSNNSQQKYMKHIKNSLIDSMGRDSN